MTAYVYGKLDEFKLPAPQQHGTPAVSKTTTVKWEKPAPKPPCHTGSLKVIERTGHWLKAGGWSRGLVILQSDVFIDLAENIATESKASLAEEIGGYGYFTNFLSAYKNKPKAPMLSLPIRDYGLPELDKDDWVRLADAVKNVMTQHDVLIACQGGHGRTGMVVSILAYMLTEGAEHELWAADPVARLRSVYCNEAVDTAKQHQYIYDMLGINIDASQFYLKPTQPVEVGGYNYKAFEFGGEHVHEEKCAGCGKKKGVTGGLCEKCKTKYAKMMNEGKPLVDKKGNCIACHRSLDDDCFGVVMGKCGHIVHDESATRPDTECDACYEKGTQDMAHNIMASKTYSGQTVEEWQTQLANAKSEDFVKCPMCGVLSLSTKLYGICLSCQMKLRGEYLNFTAKLGRTPTAIEELEIFMDKDGKCLVCHQDDCEGVTYYPMVDGGCGHFTHGMDNLDEFLCPTCLERVSKNGGE